MYIIQYTCKNTLFSLIAGMQLPASYVLNGPSILFGVTDLHNYAQQRPLSLSTTILVNAFINYIVDI